MLQRHRSVTDGIVPGLDGKLAGESRADLEAADSPGLAHFLGAGGVGLLVPRDLGGLGASAVEAVSVQCAIGARSGSVAVATTMHHFSVASLRALSSVSVNGLEGMLLQAVTEQNHLLASGFAEGRPDRGILSPTMTAVPTAGGVTVTGVKRPCSLARSMTMLTASVAIPRSGAPDEVAIVLVPAQSEGLRVEPFWRTGPLAGAESEAVHLEGVHVPESLVVRTDLAPGGALDHVHRVGFCWFELLMCASYAGVAAGLVEEALTRTPAAAGVLAGDLALLTTALSGLQCLARELDAGRSDDMLLAELLAARFVLQDSFPALASRTLEVLGGMAFITDPTLAPRTASLAALGFHPPPRRKVAGQLAGALAGQPLTFD